jgi:hypothetical protein
MHQAILSIMQRTISVAAELPEAAAALKPDLP